MKGGKCTLIQQQFLCHIDLTHTHTYTAHGSKHGSTSLCAGMAQVASRDSVERFLFRTLSPLHYATLRALHPCIITADGTDEKRKKAVCWLVLLADTLMVAENPPKTVTPLVAFKDIVRIAEARHTWLGDSCDPSLTLSLPPSPSCSLAAELRGGRVLQAGRGEGAAPGD